MINQVGRSALEQYDGVPWVDERRPWATRGLGERRRPWVSRRRTGRRLMSELDMVPAAVLQCVAYLVPVLPVDGFTLPFVE